LTIDCVVGNTQTFENNQQQNKLIEYKRGEDGGSWK
jgi:hypothetical protein